MILNAYAQNDMLNLFFRVVFDSVMRHFDVINDVMIDVRMSTVVYCRVYNGSFPSLASYTEIVTCMQIFNQNVTSTRKPTPG